MCFCTTSLLFVNKTSPLWGLQSIPSPWGTWCRIVAKVTAGHRRCCRGETDKRGNYQGVCSNNLSSIVLGLTLTTRLIECSKSSAPYIGTIYLHIFPVVCNFFNMRSGPYHLNIRTELVFHTTSEPDCPGPATTYLNVVTVYLRLNRTEPNRINHTNGTVEP